MRNRNYMLIGIGAFTLSLAALLGAYGSHGVQGAVNAQTWAAYEVAVDYQFYHGLGIIVAGMLAERAPKSRWVASSGWVLLFGVIAFSGGIYATTFGAPDVIGALTPIGGVGLIVGWLSLAFGVVRAE